LDYERMLSAVTSIMQYFKWTGHSTQFDSMDQLYNSIDQALASLSFIKPDKEMLDAIRMELQYRYQIKNSDPGHSIQFDYDAPKWYSQKLNDGKITGQFWNRYKSYLLEKKGFSEQIVADLEEKTLNAELMNFLADPDGKPGRPKRGLIIGDVQSGKTSTYTGLICKAADAGYKVFIILTGMIESLRVQTQQRIEEGFIGFDMSDPKSTRCGVGEDNKPIRASSITSRKSDFTKNSNLIAISLQHSAAVVFVLKKNTSVLTKLLDWLTKSNVDTATGKINEPMLLIDDEADNASINTNAGEDPTRINGLIRKMIDLFGISNYVGFTATPFANVFIDPLTEHDMFKHDLFPEDFIVALPVPEDYVGAAKIFHHDGKYHGQLSCIDDAGTKNTDGYSFWHLHKKDWDGELPASLTDALYAFYLANAIRDLRGHANAHRTMMINITRFTAVQYRIRDKVDAIHKAALRAIRFNIAPNNLERSLKDPILKRIHDVFVKQFTDTGATWDEVTTVLLTAVESIELKVINSSRNSDKLTYPDKEPQRVIAIGGLALSRGLTLEGLIVSYFYRNTSTYDVLMQMGRWFGYRRGYDDLFRIWISKQSADWYAEISDASDQLKSDMDVMRIQHERPRDFGIRVRNDSDKLEITARNKMRNSAVEYDYGSYYGNYIETPYLSANAADERANYELVRRLMRSAKADGVELQTEREKRSTRYLLSGVSVKRIIDLLEDVKLPDCNSHFDPKQILEFLITTCDGGLKSWDVAFVPGKDKPVEIEDLRIPRVKRNKCSILNGRLNVGERGRLGGSRDGCVGLADERLLLQAEGRFKQDYLAQYGTSYEGNSFTSYTWFRYISVDDRRPLLMLYPIQAEPSQDALLSRDFWAFQEALGDIPVFGFAIGIPMNRNEEYVKRSRFKVNRQYNFYDDGYDPEDEEGQE